MAVLNRRFHTYIKQKNCNPSLIKRNTVTALLISLLSPSSPPCSDNTVLPSRLLLSPPVMISLAPRLGLVLKHSIDVGVGVIDVDRSCVQPVDDLRSWIDVSDLDKFGFVLQRSGSHSGQQPSLANSVRWLQIQTSIATDLRFELKELIPKYQLMNPDIMNTVHEDLRYLAKGPSRYAKRFSTFSINGFSFRTTNRDNGLKTQNSGVFLMSSTPCVASASDANIRNADLSYYGKLEDIIELNYNGRFWVTLFKCKWADITRERGCRKDSWGFTSVNFSRVIHSGDREEDDPYIEASQARMVYFVNDEVNKDWSVVVHLKPRDSYDMGGNEDDEECENEPWLEQNLDSLFENGDNLSLLRDEVDDELLDDDIGEDEHMSE
nr:uncharacterized protein LOC112779493 [Arachis hypogaea]